MNTLATIENPSDLPDDGDTMFEQPVSAGPSGNDMSDTRGTYTVVGDEPHWVPGMGE